MNTFNDLLISVSPQCKLPEGNDNMQDEWISTEF